MAVWSVLMFCGNYFTYFWGSGGLLESTQKEYSSPKLGVLPFACLGRPTRASARSLTGCAKGWWRPRLVPACPQGLQYLHNEEDSGFEYMEFFIWLGPYNIFLFGALTLDPLGLILEQLLSATTQRRSLHGRVLCYDIPWLPLDVPVAGVLRSVHVKAPVS